MITDNSILIGLLSDQKKTTQPAELAPQIDAGSFGYNPASEIIARDMQVEILVELPGVVEKDITIMASSHAIIVTGQKRAVPIGMTCEMYQCDRNFGRFERRFDLPYPVTATSIAASVAAGVLKICAPKAGGRFNTAL